MSDIYVHVPPSAPPWAARWPERRRGRSGRRRPDPLLAEGDQRDAADDSPEAGARDGRRDGRRDRGHRHGAGRRGPGFGPGFGPGPGRRRAARGNVRNAVLALLAEEPQHGYAVIGQLAERSGGLWRPSPGSVYPVLGQLEEEGLVTSDESGGRKVFALTDAGRAYVEAHADELREPWTPEESRHRDRAVSLFEAVRSLGGAAREVARNGSDAQVEQARTVLDGARRAMYRILADEPAAPPDRPAPDPAPGDDPTG